MPNKSYHYGPAEEPGQLFLSIVITLSILVHFSTLFANATLFPFQSLLSWICTMEHFVLGWSVFTIQLIKDTKLREQIVFERLNAIFDTILHTTRGNK